MSNLRNILVLALLTLTLGACDLAQGIFKGGFIIGLIVAVVVVGLLFKMFSGRGKAP